MNLMHQITPLQLLTNIFEIHWTVLQLILFSATFHSQEANSTLTVLFLICK